MKRVLLVLLVACTGGDPDLCERLAEAPSCGSNAEMLCHQAIDTQNRDTPQCRTYLQALADCAADLRDVGCSGSTSAYANGDGEFVGPSNFALVGGFDLVVNDTKCSRLKNMYDDCAGNQ